MTAPVAVSVVIPVRDDAVLLERCLEALADQSEPVFEVIVVDNDSTDLTATVAEWWGCRCVREQRPGIPAAASAGYDAAQGDVIARLDADSVPARDWVRTIVEAFAAEPDLTAITGPGRFLGLPTPLRALADLVYMRAYFTVFHGLVGHPPLFGSNFALARSAWLVARMTVHRADPEVHDDLDLSFQLPDDARVVLDPALTVGISARPFTTPKGFAHRVARGVHTVATNRDRVRPLRGVRAGAAESRIRDALHSGDRGDRMPR